jgi:3-deoxy-7-phosphoheptulonate synthase
MQKVAVCLRRNQLGWIRGGAFKLRTSSHSFQGLGQAGLDILARIAQEYGLATITEVVSTGSLEATAQAVDALQVGARNMYNYELLKAVSRVIAQSHQPVLLKRGIAATIAEWLEAAAYLALADNSDVMLCERGLRTFEQSYRYTLDIAAVAVVHQRSPLPVCVDVSHAAGTAALVPSLAQAAVAAGADALMIEVHPSPLHARSDGAQQLSIQEFEELLPRLRRIAATLDKKII